MFALHFLRLSRIVLECCDFIEFSWKMRKNLIEIYLSKMNNLIWNFKINVLKIVENPSSCFLHFFLQTLGWEKNIFVFCFNGNERKQKGLIDNKVIYNQTKSTIKGDKDAISQMMIWIWGCQMCWFIFWKFLWLKIRNS